VGAGREARLLNAGPEDIRAGVFQPAAIKKTVPDTFSFFVDNLVYNAIGAGIVQEDGSETGNEFLYNFVLRNNGSGEKIDDGTLAIRPGQTFLATRTGNEVGHEGAGFWLRSWNETVLIGNVVVGSDKGGFSIFAGNASDHIPLIPGSSTVRTSKLSLLNPSVFRDNEVYGGTATALDPWFQDKPQFVIENFAAWHIYQTGVGFHYSGGPVTD
jgi:hypothetical protein